MALVFNDLCVSGRHNLSAHAAPPGFPTAQAISAEVAQQIVRPHAQLDVDFAWQLALAGSHGLKLIHGRQDMGGNVRPETCFLIGDGHARKPLMAAIWRLGAYSSGKHIYLNGQRETWWIWVGTEQPDGPGRAFLAAVSLR